MTNVTSRWLASNETTKRSPAGPKVTGSGIADAGAAGVVSGKRSYSRSPQRWSRTSDENAGRTASATRRTTRPAPSYRRRITPRVVESASASASTDSASADPASAASVATASPAGSAGSPSPRSASAVAAVPAASSGAVEPGAASAFARCCTT